MCCICSSKKCFFFLYINGSLHIKYIHIQTWNTSLILIHFFIKVIHFVGKRICFQRLDNFVMALKRNLIWKEVVNWRKMENLNSLCCDIWYFMFNQSTTCIWQAHLENEQNNKQTNKHKRSYTFNVLSQTSNLCFGKSLSSHCYIYITMMAKL